MSAGLHVVTPPEGGVWRVGRQPDPLELPDPAPYDAGDAGNRFDSFLGNYSVLYCATGQQTCFAEVLARLRARSNLAGLVSEQWRSMGFMNVNAIAREWRNDRRLARVGFRGDARFVDVDHPDTLAALEDELGGWLLHEDLAMLDTSAIRSARRRLTRLISQVLWAHRDRDGYAAYAGIRYASRVEGGACWAVFGDVPIEPLETLTIRPTNDALRTVADRWDLTIH